MTSSYSPAPIRRIVIVGGGTAGWMSAALMSRSLGTQAYDITLVESEEIGTVGVGEATIPQILLYNDYLKIPEDEFVRETHATFKLGIEFVDWRRPGATYFHPFGVLGKEMDGIAFPHFWLRMLALGGHDDMGRFNPETLAARAGRFSHPVRGETPPAVKVNYAYQFDASLYAAYLRRYAEGRGVVRQEGRIVQVDQDSRNGYITGVRLDDGRVIGGDFFLDCSGFRGLLIEQTLKSGYEDWSRWLPCDRAAAVPCEKASLPDGSPAPTTPYTRATAREAGWQWRIPLQHRTGNGYVFCSQYMGEDEACEKLLSRLDGKALRDPKVLRFTTGHRRRMWDKNVVALGLASGFLEPLESTSIHLVQSGLAKLLAVFPKMGIEPSVVEHYNRDMLAEYVNVKDFLIAHYKVTERDDTPFWDYCRTMAVPDSLKSRLDMFQATAFSASTVTELFKEQSWFSVLWGQGMRPRNHHPMADVISEDELRVRLTEIRTAIQAHVDGMPSHDAFIAQHYASKMMPAL